MSGSGTFRVGDPTGERISFDGSSFIISSSDFYMGGSGQYVSGSDGKLEISSSNFHLTNTGNVTMAGKVTATTGDIGGWDIQTGYIEKDGVRLNAGNNNAYLGIGITSYATDGGIFIGETSTGLYQLSAVNGTKHLKWDGTDLTVNAGNFSLDSSGNVTATNVDLTGDITAESGYIGTEADGFTLTSEYFTSNASKTSVTDTDSGVYVGTDRFAAGTGQLIMKSSGQISGSTFKFSDNLSGDVSAARYGDASFDNYVYNDGSSFNIQTEAFNLNTANIVISSSNNGVIALGSTPPTDYEGVGASNRQKGFYVSGLGSLLLGNSDGGRIQYNHSTETLILSSSSFMLGKGKTGTGGQFISGSPNSGGTIEISSSNFHLSKTGDVKMAGTVSASAGGIGGWTINTTEISATTSSGYGSTDTIALSKNDTSLWVKDGNSDQYVAKFGKFELDTPAETAANFVNRVPNPGVENATHWTYDDTGYYKSTVTRSSTSAASGSYSIKMNFDNDAPPPAPESSSPL